MKLAFKITALGSVALSVIGCGSSGLSENQNNPGGHPSGMGPFDTRGNYVEEWADNPSKWKRGSKPSAPEPDQIQAEDPPIIAQNEQPPPTSNPLAPPVNTISRPSTVVPKPVTKTSSTAVTKTATAKPKPKVVAKTKAKTPPPTRYVIKKGDTLSAIARRNKTTVTAIQRANGISGSIIQPGKSLVIPKY